MVHAANASSGIADKRPIHSRSSVALGIGRDDFRARRGLRRALVAAICALLAPTTAGVGCGVGAAVIAMIVGIILAKGVCANNREMRIYPLAGPTGFSCQR
jgi:hypothetical protein